MNTVNDPRPASDVRLGLPKGRMEAGVRSLLAAAGVQVAADARAYRPAVSLPGFGAKLLKPQNLVGMLTAGSRDVGFAGADWVAELGADVVELLDTGLDPVRLVVAAPGRLLRAGRLPERPDGRPLVVVSEYERLAQRWIAANAPAAVFVRAYGATEVFPPEDADAILDNTATGATLAANGLQVVDEVMRSTTRLYAHPRALDDAGKRARIEGLVLCLRAALAARARAMLDLNVGEADLARVVAVLPCMREPTVASLHRGAGYAVRAAVPRADLARLLPLLKAAGATDLVVTPCEQIVP